jgi:hypothetical protein
MRRRTILIAVGALLLAGCHRHGDAARSGPSAADGVAASAGSGKNGDSDQDRANEKLDAYIKGYNTLIGTFGLSQQYQQYTGQRIAQKTVNDPVFVLPGWLSNGLDELKAARAIPGGAGDLDAAGDTLPPVLGRLVAELEGLES